MTDLMRRLLQQQHLSPLVRHYSLYLFIFALWQIFCSVCVLLWSIINLFPPSACPCMSSLLLSSMPQQGEESNEGRAWPKDQDEHPQLYFSSAPHVCFCGRLAPLSSFQSVIPALTSSSLIPHSTSCWCLLLAVMLMLTD